MYLFTERYRSTQSTARNIKNSSEGLVVSRPGRYRGNDPADWEPARCSVRFVTGSYGT